VRGHRHRAKPADVRSWSASSAHHLDPQRTTLPGVHPGPFSACLARGLDSTLTKLPRDASTRCWSGPGLEVSFLGQDPAMGQHTRMSCNGRLAGHEEDHLPSAGHDTRQPWHVGR
jgi:hypothetical protein